MKHVIKFTGGIKLKKSDKKIRGNKSGGLICRGALKRMIVTISITAILICEAFSVVEAANGDLYSSLGTSSSIGSPVLSSDFTSDEWNPWEMECWGVYLSNFCVPLVDDYRTAFTTGAGGSNGSGYKALSFGSGSDSRNNEVIEDLCSYAITQQLSTASTLFVSFNTIKDGVITKSDPNNGGIVRAAKFTDLWMIKTEEKIDWDSIGYSDNDIEFTIPIYRVNNRRIVDVNGSQYSIFEYIEDGFLPTFWIRTSSNKYVKVFDYTDSWDIQIASAIVSRVSASDNEKEFYEAFNSYYNTNDGTDGLPSWATKIKAICTAMTNTSYIKFDTFGNIVTSDNKLIIPASANQHLTSTDRINLMTSFVMNGQASATSDKNLILGARQYIDENVVGGETDGKKFGLPAISGKNTKLKNGTAYLYYDLGTIITSKFDLDQSDTLKYDSYGYDLKTLFDCDVTKRGNGVNLKLEVVNKTSNTGALWWQDTVSDGDSSTGKVLTEQLLASSIIVDQIKDINNSEVCYELVLPNGTTMELFSQQPVCVAVGLKAEEKDDSQASKVRLTWNKLYDGYKNGVQTTTGTFTSKEISDIISECEDIYKLRDKITKTKGYDGHTLLQSLETGTKLTYGIDYGGNESFDYQSMRVIILYNASETIRNVGNVLGVRNGTEFAVYSTYLYSTYLDWYGITSSKETSKFNPEIFTGVEDMLNVNIEDLIDIKTPEERKSEIEKYTLLTLSPTLGRDYRKEITMTSLMDFLNEQYNRIVYGKASDYYGVASSSDTGFLNIPTYADIPLTGFIIKNYATIAMWLIVILFAIIIVHGVITSKRLSWYFISLTITINAILIIPSTGEIVSAVSQKMVNSMFSGKMTYWSISEAIYNSNIENKSITTDSYDDTMVYLIKSLNTLYTDRSLMLKRDISAKTVQNTEGIYSQIQNYKSARWLLPTLMRQYTANDKSDANSYVYFGLADLYDDMSNLYWYYNKDDADNTNIVYATATSGQNQLEGAVYNDIDGMLSRVYSKANYGNFVDLTEFDDSSEVKFQSYSYDQHANDKKYLQHIYNYMIDGLYIPAMSSDLRSTSIKEAYNNQSTEVKNNYSLIEQFRNVESVIEDAADKYERGSRDTMNQYYGYLWSTETVAYTMYSTVKDTLSSSVSLGYIIGQLQGTYALNKNGEEKRSSFMHATYVNSNDASGTEYATGYVRDVCDLQNIFANEVPYLYSIMTMAGGIDGESGIFVDENGDAEKIKNYELYKSNNKSWLFRSNWVIKLMENREYTEPQVVSDKDGNEYTVVNPLLYSSYPSERPMVFSEAQKEAYGLDDSDLSSIELKCIKVNDAVCDDWTLLINYANTDGVTKEVLVREMALLATFEFNKQFSPRGIAGSEYQLYPQSVDLRNISFDSIMKMLALNSSKDATYIYGNTMNAVLNNSDIITAIILLLDAFICAYIVPIVRMILMAEIFYLGFIALFRSVLGDNKFKFKVSIGQISSNILFTVITMAYYAVFVLLTSIVSTDEVLSVSYIQGNTGSVIGTLLVVLIDCIVYIICMIKMINFCFKNGRDMGAEMYSVVFSTVREKVTSTLSSITREFTGKGSGSDEVNTSRGVGVSNGNSSDVDNDSSSNKNNSDSKQDNGEEYDIDLESYDWDTSDVDVSSDDINRDIDNG